MATQAATARLALDASGFDRQANASFREFSKQLTSVRDATDVAMRGAEALQKVFVRSLGGTIAIGAANALGDAMRDVGNQIGAAGAAAASANASVSGIADSFQSGADRARQLADAAAATAKSLDTLRSASPLQAGIFSAFGGDKVLQDLEDSQRSLAAMELLTGTRQGNRNLGRLAAAGPSGRAAEQQRQADEAERQSLLRNPALSGADSKMRESILQAFDQKKALEQQIRDQDAAAKRQQEIDARETRAQDAYYARLDAAEKEKEDRRKRMDEEEREMRRREFQRRMDADEAYDRVRMSAAMEQARQPSDTIPGRAPGADRLSQLEADIEGDNDSRAVGIRQRMARARQKNKRKRSRAALKNFQEDAKNAGYAGNSEKYMEKLLEDPGAPPMSAQGAAGMADQGLLASALPSLQAGAVGGLASPDMVQSFLGGAGQSSGGGNIYELLSNVLNKLVAAPTVGVE